MNYEIIVCGRSIRETYEHSTNSIHDTITTYVSVDRQGNLFHDNQCTILDSMSNDS